MNGGDKERGLGIMPRPLSFTTSFLIDTAK